MPLGVGSRPRGRSRRGGPKTYRRKRRWPEYPRPQMVREEVDESQRAVAVRDPAEGDEQAGEVGRRNPGAVSGRVGAVGREETSPARPAALVSPHISMPKPKPKINACCCTSARSIGSARFGSTTRRSASTRAATIRSRSTSPMHFAKGDNELVVAVTDPTDTGTQPRGKQVLKPHGIFYTAVTGIWQTVWLEPVPKRSHRVARRSCRMSIARCVTVTVQANGGRRPRQLFERDHAGWRGLLPQRSRRSGRADRAQHSERQALVARTSAFV